MNQYNALQNKLSTGGLVSATANTRSDIFGKRLPQAMDLADAYRPQPEAPSARDAHEVLEKQSKRAHTIWNLTQELGSPTLRRAKTLSIAHSRTSLRKSKAKTNE